MLILYSSLESSRLRHIRQDLTRNLNRHLKINRKKIPGSGRPIDHSPYTLHPTPGNKVDTSTGPNLEGDKQVITDKTRS